MKQMLQKCSQADFDYLDERVTCLAVSESDFPGWEDRLRDPAASPLPHIRTQRQKMNDCQGQSLSTGTEARRHYSTGEMQQLADVYAYNATEYVTGPNNVGRDRGTNILLGVRVLTEGIPQHGIAPGLPLEENWRYNTYERSASRFIDRAKQVEIVDGCVAEQLPMPPFREMLIAVAARGTGHIGTYWPPSWAKVNNRRWMKSAPRRGGGHATQIVWAEWVDELRQWLLIVANSHGDGWYYMSESAYTALQRVQFRPYGARLLMPLEAKQKFVDWKSDSPYFD